MRNLTVFILFLFLGIELFGQSPHSFRYQAVARDNSGNVLSNQAVGFRISILSGSISGIVEYSEIHSGMSTNNFGLVEIEIGKGTPQTGTFSTINWGNNSYFVKVEIDPAGGTAYQVLSTSQLLSVPYALHANTVQNGDNWGTENVNSDATLSGNGTNSSPLKLAQQYATNGQVLKWNGNTWLPGSDLSGSSLWTQNESNIYYNNGNIGLGTNTPSTYIHAHGSPVSSRGQLSLSAPSGEGVFMSFYDADIFKAYLWYDVNDEDLRLQNFTAGDLNLNPYGGNVGIGTNSPSAALEVVGQLKITGGTPGVGKLLTSDATGLATWETPNVGDNDSDATNELQSLSISGGQLSISDGNTISLPNIIPMYTSAEIAQLTPLPGEAVLNTTESIFLFYDGTAWQILNSSCWPQPTTAFAGDDQFFADGTTNTAKLSANTPEAGYGTGEWTVYGEGGSFDDPTSPTATFTGNQCESYSLYWTIRTECSSSTDKINIVFTDEVTVADAGSSQYHYDLTTSTMLNANIPIGDETGEWTILSGEGGSFDNPNSPTAIFTGNLCTSYNLRWTISNGCSSSSDDVSIGSAPSVTQANAGWDQIINDGTTTATLAANAVEVEHETGEWTIRSGQGGSFDDPSSPTTTFTGNQCELYILRWNISCGDNGKSNDEVLIRFTIDPPTADAGEDQVITGGTTATALSANSPEADETGVWTVLSGEGGSFTDPTSPTTNFSGLIKESYTLKWTISTECNYDTDEVKIAFWSEDFELTDDGGNVYQTVVIGNQIWMAENLRYLPSVSPSSNGSTTVPYCYVYGYEGSDVSVAKETDEYKTYGVLYNWPAAKSVCPQGWHVASAYEWQDLAQYVSDQMGPYNNSGYNWNNVGGHLKAINGWNEPNGTDDFGFSALPGGSRDSQGIFSGLGDRAAWWTSTSRGTGINNDRYINSYNSFGSLLSEFWDKGYCVRCIKD